MLLCFVSVCLILLLPFVWVSFFCMCMCVFVLNPPYCHDKWLQRAGLGSPTRSWAWTSGMGAQSPDARLPENSWPWESINQCELPQRRPSNSRTQHHPTVCNTQCWIHHPTTCQTGTQTRPSAVRHRHHKTHHFTWPCPPEGKKKPPSPTRMQAQVPLNMKPTQVTRRPTSPAGGRDQKQELQPYSLVKGDLKHSKLDKRKYQRTIVQTKEQGKTHKTKYTKRK